MKLLIRGARLIDEASGLDMPGDVLIGGGRILKIAPALVSDADHILDARGLCAAPGLVDIHVHFRDPGQTHKEDIFTGAAAAAAGGFTAVCCMPNTSPAADTPETVAYIESRGRRADARVYPIGAVTLGQQGREMTDFAALKAAGAVAFSDDGRPVENPDMLVRAMREAERLGMKVISHCEDLKIIDGGIMHKGRVSEALGVKGMDRLSEDSSTKRELALAEQNGLPIHIAHVSTAGSVELIRQAKARGVRVTAETAPHYMLMTHELLSKRDADYRMNPPLRELEDLEAIIRGFADGTLDVLATDHAPHAREEKADFESAPNGVVGLETSLAAALTALVHTGRMELPRLIYKMTALPARIIGIPAPALQVGADADIVLFDPEERWTVAPDALHSRSRNTLFKGIELTGRVVYTLMKGRMTYRGLQMAGRE